jgi:hypothetical protein
MLKVITHIFCFKYVVGCLGMMDSDDQTKVDPRKQALLEARFFGTGRENIEVLYYSLGNPILFYEIK